MNNRLRLPWVIGAIVLLLLGAAIVTVNRGQASGCPAGSLSHPPAGSCMNPAALDVDGELSLVEAAVSEYDGVILYTTFNTHHVRFPVDDAAKLDRIKNALTGEGLTVRYSLVLELP